MKNKFELEAQVFNKHGRLLATGHNSYTKTHPWQKEMAEKVGRGKAQFLHAEVAALIKCKSSKPYKISITRKDRWGNLKLAMPCEICSLAIQIAGIKKIEYSVG